MYFFDVNITEKHECMWWHTFSHPLPAYLRALIISLASMRVCIRECVDHTVRAQGLCGVKPYLKLITTHRTHAQRMATHDCTRTYTYTHCSSHMYSDKACLFDFTAKDSILVCRKSHTRISRKPSSERLAKASQPGGRFFIMHGTRSLADVVKSLGDQ